MHHAKSGVAVAAPLLDLVIAYPAVESFDHLGVDLGEGHVADVTLEELHVVSKHGLAPVAYVSRFGLGIYPLVGEDAEARIGLGYPQAVLKVALELVPGLPGVCLRPVHGQRLAGVLPRDGVATQRQTHLPQVGAALGYASVSFCHVLSPPSFVSALASIPNALAGGFGFAFYA